MREIYNMNFGWSYHDSDIPCPNFHSVHDSFEYPVLMKSANCGIGKVGYNIGEWKTVQLPHDLRHDRAVYDKTVPASQGYLATGIGWYRKEFFIEDKVEGKSVWIEFDGIFRDSDVYVNGCFVGNHKSGYTSFSYDITDFILTGENNAIAVRVDGTKFEGWWYEAAGIYRDVRMVITDRLHFKKDGVYVKYDLSGNNAKVKVLAEIQNQSGYEGEIAIGLDIVDPDGKTIVSKFYPKVIKAYKDEIVELEEEICDVQLWDIDDTKQYSALLSVISKNKVLDHCRQKFGMRTIEYSPDEGVILNGRKIKIQGVCVHDDFAGVGGALSRSVIRHKIYLLKEMGCNGYRCSHNPPSPYLLEACDDYGLLVMDEVRMMNSSEEHLNQMRDLMKRDRNHPSVFLWSLGNEEMGIHGTRLGVQIVNHMLREAHAIDSTRPCIYANNGIWKKITVYHEEHGLHMDVFGFNYNCLRNFDSYAYIKERYPDRFMIGTENASTLSTRGQYTPREQEVYPDCFSEGFAERMIWQNPERKYNVSAYGESFPLWGSTPMETLNATDPDYVGGYFIWTGFDYRGEISPMIWPSTISRYGINDLCGFMKDTGHQYRVKWSKEPAIYMYPHWSFEEGTGTIEVDVVSNTEEVELFVNDISKGKRKCLKRELVKYDVAYEKGEIKAVGYNGGQKVVEMEHKTAGEPKSILLEIVQNRKYVANGEDCIFVKVSTLDKKGVHCPDGDNLIKYEVDGEGEILGVGNGDPLCMEDEKKPYRKLFHGLGLVILRTTRNMGTIKLTAHGEGLESAEINIVVDLPAEDVLVSDSRVSIDESEEKMKDAADGLF